MRLVSKAMEETDLSVLASRPKKMIGSHILWRPFFKCI